MNEGATDVSTVPLRGKPPAGFCWQENELDSLFLPIIGLAAYALYCHLTRKAFGATFTCTVREIAHEIERSRTTVWRELSVLECIGMVRLQAGGGNQKSECSLVDLRALAIRLGAIHDKRAASFVLAPDRVQPLKAKVAALRIAQAGKKDTKCQSQPLKSGSTVHETCANLFLPDHRRDARVTPEERQRPARETKAGSHLIRQNTIPPKLPTPTPTPTPSNDNEAQKDKDVPDEDEPEDPLKCARRAFIGVMDEMRAHLLETGRPPNPRFANGGADWKEFDFGGLAVAAATKLGNEWALVLYARDLAAARSGLEKYQRKWNASLRNWFGCKVYCELRDTTSERRPNAKKC